MEENQIVEENQITVVDEEGNEHLCDILFTFEHEQFGKKMYVVYSPVGEVDEDGDRIYLAAIVEEEGDEGGRLVDIENDEELDMVYEVFGAFLDDEEDEDEE